MLGVLKPALMPSRGLCGHVSDCSSIKAAATARKKQLPAPEAWTGPGLKAGGWRLEAGEREEPSLFS